MTATCPTSPSWAPAPKKPRERGFDAFSVKGGILDWPYGLERGACSGIAKIPRRQFAQLLVDVEDSTYIDIVADQVQAYVEANYHDAVPQIRKFILGPGDPGKIQAKRIWAFGL